LRSAWARFSSAFQRRVTSDSFMGATRPGAHDQPCSGNLPLSEKFQFPLVDGRSPDLQHRHLDAAYRAGLACSHATAPSRCVGAGHCHWPAVRPAPSAPSLDRICRRPPRSAQVVDGHPGGYG
jgi:hypothetical protein